MSALEDNMLLVLNIIISLTAHMNPLERDNKLVTYHSWSALQMAPPLLSSCS